MLVNFSEQIIQQFKIPAFSLNAGDIVVVQLANGPFFKPVEMELIAILTGAQKNDGVTINTNFSYAGDIKIRSSWDRFFPITVGRHLNKFADKLNPLHEMGFEIPGVSMNKPINGLTNTQRRLVSLYSTLSHTHQIIFDLQGIDPSGGQQIYDAVKSVTAKGVTAILFDYCDEFKDDCTRFVKATYLGGT